MVDLRMAIHRKKRPDLVDYSSSWDILPIPKIVLLNTKKLLVKETMMNKMTWIALGVVAAVLLSMAVFCPLAGKCPMHLFQ